MTTGTETTYRAGSLDVIEPAALLQPGAPDGRVRLDVRRHFGIEAFGINAFRSDSGVEILREHTENGIGGPEQQELYIVLSGSATFNIDGERVEAPSGSLVFVGDPGARRGAVADEDGTTILAIGAPRGTAYEPPPVETGEAFAAYNVGDYETAYAKQLVVLEKRPTAVLAHFNAGCYAAKLGRTGEAVAHLRRALEADDRIREYLEKDEDLDGLRTDSRFTALIS